MLRRRRSHPKIAFPLLLDFLDHCRIVLGSPLARNMQVPSVAYHFGGKARLGKKKKKELLIGNINLITLSELQEEALKIIEAARCLGS